MVHVTTTRPRVQVTADGAGVVSHAGTRLLADLAERTGLTTALGDALLGLRQRRSAHDPGRVLVDLALTLAAGGRTISDLAILREQPEVFGPVASDATAWRVLDAISEGELGAIRGARAAARETLWAQRAHARGPLPGHVAAGRTWPGVRIVMDASLITAHSEKELAAPTFKHGFGHHPLLAYCDNTGEHLAGLLRPGNAGSNTATDHITVLDLALAQLPDDVRHGTPILVSTDGAGGTKEFLHHVRSLRHTGVNIEFSMGFTMTPRVQAAVLALPECAWTPAIDSGGDPREGADVAELTGMLTGLDGDLSAHGWPAGMRVIVRRERPHPGAQLRFTDYNGWRVQAFATDTKAGNLPALDARHRAHARVEDRIRNAKNTGLAHLPSRQANINRVWLEVVAIATDLIAWAQSTLLDGELAKVEPKLLRYRLLHVAARITRGQRRTWLRIDNQWPWRLDLARAFARLHTLPLPQT